MFYEESVVDGVLCWRGRPDGDWVPCSYRKITERLIEARAKLVELASTPHNRPITPATCQAMSRMIGDSGQRELVVTL